VLKFKINFRHQRVKEIQDDSPKVFDSLTEKAFQEAFQKWRRRWDWYLHEGGNYFESNGGRYALWWVLWVLQFSPEYFRYTLVAKRFNSLTGVSAPIPAGVCCPTAGSSSRPKFRTTQSYFSPPPVSNTSVTGIIRWQHASRNLHTSYSLLSPWYQSRVGYRTRMTSAEYPLPRSTVRTSASQRFHEVRCSFLIVSLPHTNLFAFTSLKTECSLYVQHAHNTTCCATLGLTL
jgi:hypothetical protein